MDGDIDLSDGLIEAVASINLVDDGRSCFGSFDLISAISTEDYNNFFYLTMVCKTERISFDINFWKTTFG